MSEEKKVEEWKRREDEEIEGDGVSERWGVGWEGGVRRERGEGAVTGEDVPKRSMLISGGWGV